ncbi:hypothetical protein ACVIM8_001715 [Bradyrhizobium sp. USDA 4529]
MQNAFIQSFNGRQRDELLSETLFASLARPAWRSDVGAPITARREDASEFAITCNPRPDLALPCAEGSAPTPVATTAQMGKSTDRGELRTG